MKKVIIFLLSTIIVLGGIYFAGSGFIVRNDVYLTDFSVSEDGSEMTLYVGVTGSAGYIRTFKDVSSEKEIADLKFYSAFGGVNGSISKKDSFQIVLSEKTKEIRFYSENSFYPVLIKNEVSGEWEKVK